MPFGLLKDPQRPPGTDMTSQSPVHLAPQRWNPAGNFPTGSTLFGDNLQVRVVSKQDDCLQVDRLLTRKEAASLHSSCVSADPNIWSRHFLGQWGQFWNMPAVDDEYIEEVTEKMPQLPPMSFKPPCVLKIGATHSSRLVNAP